MDTIKKNAKQLVNEYCQREKIPNPAYVCTPDKEKVPTGYTCVLTVRGQTFRTEHVVNTKKNAELEAAKIACEKLNMQAEVRTEPKDKKINAITDGLFATTNNNKVTKKADKPAVKEPGWITIERVEDIYNHLSDEVLAQEFKSFLHCKAQEEKKNYPEFAVTEVKEPIAGYTCVVTYDGKKYESLGLMNSKKQAEQSASEVALRALGNFADVPKDQYTIQVWSGGKLAMPPQLAQQKKQKVA